MKNLLAFQSEPVPTAVTRGRFVATAADAAAEYVGEGPKRRGDRANYDSFRTAPILL